MLLAKFSEPPLLDPPTLLLAVSDRLPLPLTVTGAFTLMLLNAESVSPAELLQESAASTLILPAPLDCVPEPLAPGAVVSSVTFVPLLSEPSIVLAAVESIVRSVGSIVHVPPRPAATVALPSETNSPEVSICPPPVKPAASSTDPASSVTLFPLATIAPPAPLAFFALTFPVMLTAPPGAVSHTCPLII